MIVQYYAWKNEKIGAFETIFPSNEKEEALLEEVRRTTKLKNWPEKFRPEEKSLWKLFTLDDKTGEIKSNKNFLVSLGEYLNE